MPDYDDGDDRYDEYKDAVAMGYINADGSPREPDESAYIEQQLEQEHMDEVHGGGQCDCPPPTQASIDAWWARQDQEHRNQEHGGGKCNCPPEEAPF